MPRPRSFSLGPFTNEIRWPARIGKAKSPDPETELVGLCVAAKHRVEVARSQDPQEQRSTLVHEMIHMALAPTLLQSMAGWDDETEEAVVLALEGPLFELFARPENEPVRRWLEG